MIEAVHNVFLGGRTIGRLLQRGDVTRFVFEQSYWSDPRRPVLGLWFEDNPRVSPQAALNLPRWFSNLLPEGPLREWIAIDRGVSPDRELQLLLQIGKDLPGGVEILPSEDEAVDIDSMVNISSNDARLAQSLPSVWKFSLAGVGLKFSMLKNGDRLSIPASNQLGNWIVKFPDSVYTDVPINEFASMSMARDMGIETPQIRLVHREELPRLPEVMWPGNEEYAFAIERFDRSPNGARVHIEDFAQVRNFHRHDKYAGKFETVAGLAFRGVDHESLREFVRRLTFNFLIGNGDAHLKNWSLIYRDGRNPTLSPAYDIVSTACYSHPSHIDDIGLKFGNTKEFARLTRGHFAHLQSRLGVADSDVLDVLDSTLEKFRELWVDEIKDRFPVDVRMWIDAALPDMLSRLSK